MRVVGPCGREPTRPNNYRLFILEPRCAADYSTEISSRPNTPTSNTPQNPWPRLSLSLSGSHESSTLANRYSSAAMAYRSSYPDPESSDQRGERLYNPYQDLQLPAKTLYRLPTSPEFLFSEESLHQRRSWGENLTFYTGCGYLAGSIAGAFRGAFEGFKSVETSDTLKLKVNRLLNSSGHSGRVWGNRLGVIGLIYAGIESGIMVATDRDDMWSSFGAGLGTGAVYRAARGVRSAAVAGALGGVAAAAAVAGKQALKRYVPIWGLVTP